MMPIQGVDWGLSGQERGSVLSPPSFKGGGLTLKHCGVETHGSSKWYPPPPEEAFLFLEGEIAFL